MKLQQPLQSFIDPFIKSCDGELVASILDSGSNPPKNADYVFRLAGVIAELKGLEEASFGESFQNKMSALVESWANRGLGIIWGTQRVDLAQLPPVCQQEVLDVIGKPLQRNILAKANQQIRATKESLKLPDAKGLLMVASDGNEDLLPMDVLFFFWRILQKRHADGTPQYSSIDALLYFNPRMPAVLPSTGQPALIWGIALRQPEDQQMLDFLHELGDAFQRHMEKTTGTLFPSVEVEDAQYRELRFAGVSRRVPRIDANYEAAKDK
jgi:hypothetical protein